MSSATALLRVVMVAGALMLGLMATSAFAATGHNYAGQFGTPGANGPGGFAGGGPWGLVVRQSTGDIYVADPGHVAGDGSPAPRIERFNASGDYQSSFAIDPTIYGFLNGLGIDSSGNVYAAAIEAGLAVVLKYSAAGVYAYTINAAPGTAIPYPTSIAVDPTDGSVYIGAVDDTTQLPVITKFDSSGAFVTSFDGSTGSPDGAVQGIAINGLTVDATGDVYVADNVRPRVDRFDSTGTWEATVDDGSRGAPATIVADPASSELYVVENGALGQQVTAFNAGGATPLESFGAGRIQAAAQVAVNSASGTVYISDVVSNVVERFTEFTGPDVTTDAAASIDATSETLNGTINPGGAEATYHFEYGPDTNYGLRTTELSAGNGNVDVPVTDVATGLTPNTLYHVRLVGSSDGGTINGNDTMFTTAPAAAVVDGTDPPGSAPANASAITPTGATLNGIVNAKGSATTFHFDYGTATNTYTSTVPNPAGDAGSAQGDVLVSTEVTGLTPNTTYYYRVSADNGTGGAQNGAEQTFTTAPATAGGATSVTAVAATLTGAVNPRGHLSTYHFEYGLDTNYGKSTVEKTAGAGNSESAVLSGVTGLQPGTTYHVRVVTLDLVTNVTTAGVDGTFTTDPAPNAVTGVDPPTTTTSATFSGTVDTHGLAGSYQFYVNSSTSPYSIKTAPQPIAAGSGPGSVSGALSDLPPGGRYTVRLVVTSSGATTFGDSVSFETAAKPVGPPPPPPLPVTNPYGCTAPALTAYGPHPKPGDTITIAGSDLGVGGSVALGTTTVNATGWSATGFTITLPDDATGTLPLTVNCGAVSNTVAIAMYKAPSNSFTATGKVKGSTATLTIKVPGPGTIMVTGGSVKKATKHASKAGTNSVKVTLTSKAVKSLRKHRKLAVSLTVRFTPTAGTPATKTETITFTRKAAR